MTATTFSGYTDAFAMYERVNPTLNRDDELRKTLRKLKKRLKKVDTQSNTEKTTVDESASFFTKVKVSFVKAIPIILTTVASIVVKKIFKLN